MSKKIILVLLVFVFLFSFKLALADLVINEIMYAPASGSDHEWVEVFNKGNNSVNLENYRFFHGETNSGPLSLKNGSTFILQPSEYAIVAKSLADYSWLNFSGMILSASTLSLPDSGDNTYIAISDPSKKIIDSVTYDTSLGGDKNSGNSLSKINNVWQAALPTPGAVNQDSLSPIVPPDNVASSSPSDNNNSTQNTTEVKTKTKVVEVPKIKTKISAKTLVFTGIPIEFKTKTTGYVNEPLSYGKYFWNFGDGDSKEVRVNEVTNFTHTFYYEGEYTVTLEYYTNYYSENPDASDKINIKVVPVDIIISKVGDEKDFFIEISNNTNYDADLSRWILVSNEKSFTLPKNMIIESKNKITLSPKITGFSVLDKNNLKLLNSQREIISDYSSVVTKPATISKQVEILEKKSTPVKIYTVKTASGMIQNNVQEDKSKNLLENNTNVDIPIDNLGAEAIKTDTNTDNGLTYAVFGLLAFLGIGAIAAYYIRNYNKKITPEINGSDFEIIDE